MKRSLFMVLGLLLLVLLPLHFSMAGGPVAIPASISLDPYVCTADPTQVGKFGLLRCSDVEKKAADALAAEMRTVIAHYYNGELLDYNFNKGPDNKSKLEFCKSVDAQNNPVFVVHPVCNIGDPLITTSGGTGEIEQNWKGESCKNAVLAGQPSPPQLPGSPQQEGFCRIDVDGDNKVSVDMASCHREQAWTSGMRVQLWQHFYGIVKNEINSGTLNLHAVQNTGVQPCGEIGKVLVQLVVGDKSDPKNPKYGLTETHNEVAALYQPTESELKTGETEGCVGAENVTDRQLSDQEAEQRAFEANARGLATEKKHVSQAFCHVAYAHRYVEYLFHSLAMCEVMTRAKESYYDHYYSMDALLTPLMDGVINPCAKMGSAESGASCDAGCVIPHYISCYKTGNYTGDHNGNPNPTYRGVIDVFQQASQGDGLKVSNTDGLFDNTTGSDGSVIGFRDLLKTSPEPIPICGSMLIPVFKIKRNRKRKKQWFLGLLLGLLMLCLVSGCDRDVPGVNMPCPSTGKSTPCKATDQSCIQNATSPQNCPPPEGPSNSISPQADEANNAITTARALAGKSAIEAPKVASNLGGSDASAAKASFGGIPGKGLGKGGGTPSGNLSGLGKGLDQGGGGSQVASQDSSNKSDQGNSGNKADDTGVNDGSGQYQGNTGVDFGSGGKGGGGGGAKHPLFGSGFGSDGSAQAAGAETIAFDGLNQNKDQSLFEIINIRYEKESPALIEP